MRGLEPPQIRLITIILVAVIFVLVLILASLVTGH